MGLALDASSEALDGGLVLEILPFVNFGKL